MQAISSFVSGTVSTIGAALDFNKSALSGALDIVAVRHSETDVQCTPFHVRFGKLRLLRVRDRSVRVYVNGKRTPLIMRVS